MARAYDFLANTSDGVFVIDRRQRVLLWNEGAEEILGHRSSEALGRCCCGLLCARDADDVAICRPDCSLMRAARRLERVSNLDLKARRKDGRDVWLNVSTIVLPGPDRDLAAVVHLFHDVSRGHAAEELVDNLASSLERLPESCPEGADPDEPRRPSEPAPSLTAREKEILGLLASGLPTRAIAQRLFISRRTVGNHVQSVLDKLGVHSRLEAVVHALRSGLL